MRNEFRLFLTAWIFFTRIPSPVRFAYLPELANQAAKYLPLIGIIIGSLCAVVFWSMLWIFPLGVAILLSMITGVLATGGLHEDGFADACDGFGGGRNREDILRIMQDSRVGAFGSMGIALLLLLKFQALASLPAELVPIALIVSHSLSRLAAVSLLQTHLYLRRENEGKCHGVARPMTNAGFTAALVIGMLPLAWLGTKVAILIIVMAGAMRLFIGYYFSRRLGGYTGDCLGAVQQVIEVVIYLGLFSVSRFT